MTTIRFVATADKIGALARLMPMGVVTPPALKGEFLLHYLDISCSFASYGMGGHEVDLYGVGPQGYISVPDKMFSLFWINSL